MQQLKSYFKPLGLTSSESIRMIGTAGTFGSVQFLQDTESILKVLSAENHNFDGDVNVWVEMRDNDLARDLLRRHYVSDEIDIAEPANGETPIFSLNDDCLNGIFSYLSPFELVPVLKTCRRFRTISLMLFKTAYRIIDFGNLESMAKIDDMKQVLIFFGRCIIDLTIECRNFHGHLALEIIWRLCSGTLKTLRLNGFKKFDDGLPCLQKIRMLFSSMESIVLTDCSIDPSFLSECSKLVHLEIRSERYCYRTAFEYCYPQLKTFILGENRLNQTFPFGTFFQNHKNLEKIVIEPQMFERNEIARTKMLQLMIEHVGENLQSLELDGFQIEEDMVPQLQRIISKLKILKLHRFGDEKILPLGLFSNGNQLKELDVQPLHHTNALETVFPKLELIRLHSVEGKAKIFKRFLRKQDNLREVNMKNIDAGQSSDILLFIVNELKYMKKLKLNFKNIDYSNRLRNLKKLKRMQIYRNHPKISTFINDLAWKGSLEYLELCSYDINEHLIDAIAEYPKIRQLNLSGWLSCEVAGGPFTILKYLLTRLYYIPLLIITVHKVLLEDRAYDELMKMAAENKQILDLFRRRNLPEGYMFEMEMDTI